MNRIYRRAASVAGGVFLAGFLTACGGAGTSAVGGSSTTTGSKSGAGSASSGTIPPTVAPSAVIAGVAQAQTITKLPAGLHPSLTNTTDTEMLQSGDQCVYGGVLAVPKPVPPPGSDTWHFGACVYGDVHAQRLLVIFGDSHAGMYLNGLQAAGLQNGWRVEAFFDPACPAPSLTFYNQQTKSPDRGCNGFRAAAIREIRQLHPTLVVVTSGSLQLLSASHEATAADWQTGYTTTLKRLGEPGTGLAVLGDLPVLAQESAACMAAHESNIQTCATPISQATQGILNGAEQVAAAAAGATYVSPDPWICAAKCVPVVDNIRVFIDQYHLSGTYSTYLSGTLAQSLGM